MSIKEKIEKTLADPQYKAWLSRIQRHQTVYSALGGSFTVRRVKKPEEGGGWVDTSGNEIDPDGRVPGCFVIVGDERVGDILAPLYNVHLPLPASEIRKVRFDGAVYVDSEEAGMALADELSKAIGDILGKHARRRDPYITVTYP